MGKKIMVCITFVNEKGQIKTVRFPMDKKTYDILQNVSQEMRDKYLLEEYREYCKEQKYRRRNITFSDLETKMQTVEAFGEEEFIVIADDYDLYEDEIQKLSVKQIERHLDEDEYALYYKHFYLQKCNVDIAKELNVSEGTVRYKMKKLIEKLKTLI